MMPDPEADSLLGRPLIYAAMAAVLLAAAAYRFSKGEAETAGFAGTAAAAAACCAGEAWTGRRAFLWAGGACVVAAMVFLWFDYA